MIPTAIRVRDRHFIQESVLHQHASLLSTNRKTGSYLPEPELVTAVVEAIWEPRSVTAKTAFLGITKAVKKIFGLIKRAPQAWGRLQQTLAIPGWDSMSLSEKAKALGSRLKELLHEGKRVLGKAFKSMATTFPLSLFFVPKGKMPGLADLLQRISQSVPWLDKALKGISAGAVKVDQLFEKYIPKLRKPIYAAVFIWIWLNVAELSWDMQGIIAGFTGQISLGELLASLPESGLGFIAAAFGLGYGALPYAMIARLMWLVAQNYLEYVPGKGFKVQWAKMGIRQRSELVPA